jgi:cytochrome c oxidase assembly protein subunit 15
MLLYPVTQMKGGVFYEHAHRLFGTLVGVATLVTFVTVFKTQRRMVPRVLVTLLLFLVIAQGVLGGLRVTGTVTTATDAAHLAPNKWYGVVHGVLAQVVFGIAAVLPLTVTKLWATAVPLQLPRARSIRLLPALALAALFVQLILGTAMRHLQERGLPTEGPHIPRWARDGHITMAVFVLVLVFAAGLRCGQAKELPSLQRNGKAALHTVSLQVLLGIFALVAVLVRRGESVPWWEVTAATAHQAVGALLLAITAMLVAQSRRLVAPSLPART